MPLKITEKKANPLLSRREIIAELEYASVTPSNADVTKQIANTEKVDEKLVKVKQIKNIYGERKAIVTAHVYDSEEILKKIEEKKKKPKPAAGAAAEEAPSKALKTK